MKSKFIDYLEVPDNIPPNSIGFGPISVQLLNWLTILIRSLTGSEVMSQLTMSICTYPSDETFDHGLLRN